MFQPRYFKQHNIQALYAFIQEHSLATIVNCTEKGMLANHIPVILIQRGDKTFLQGHVAKVNDMWKQHLPNTDILAIFQGPEAYISPSWYPSKQLDGKAVPTWNYSSVHVSGAISFSHDKHWLIQHLTALSNHNEKEMPEPWHISDAPTDYIDKMLGAIVGFEIDIKNIIGQSKMSQNQSLDNQKGVIQGLNSQAKEKVANWVKKPNM